MKIIYKMVKKGKFKLLSYIVDENLIYYKSLNKNKKLIAFVVLQTEGLSSIIHILNDFLKKSYIKYYSIQINTQDIEKRTIIINIEDDEKNKIIKIFNILHERLIKSDINARFLNNKVLEQEFMRILFLNKKSEIKIHKKKEFLAIINDSETRILEYYNIKLDLLNGKQAPLFDIIKLVYN